MKDSSHDEAMVELFRDDPAAAAATLNAILADGDQGELLVALRKKVQDIESMEVRLAQNKAHLQSLIHLITDRPEDLTCTDNALRVMETLGITAGGAPSAADQAA